MTIRVILDQCNVERVAGWADDDGPIPLLRVELNDQPVGDIVPDIYRPDLEAVGLGDGRRGFLFSLSEEMQGKAAAIMTIKVRDQVITRRPVGDQSQFSPAILAQIFADISRERWRGDEPDDGLTFGQIMSGDTLWDAYSRYRAFRETDRILEIGPGYGRLLRTMLNRHAPFSEYAGLEISSHRVEKLRAKFVEPRVAFVNGDVDYWRGYGQFDVVISSSTFEHLYPDCSRALSNLVTQIRHGGTMFIDFIATEVSAATMEPTCYIRSYRKDELRDLFSGAGLSVLAIDGVTLGNSPVGIINRFLVIAVPVTAPIRTRT